MSIMIVYIIVKESIVHWKRHQLYFTICLFKCCVRLNLVRSDDGRKVVFNVADQMQIVGGGHGAAQRVERAAS